jgi:hypothetical protein
VSNYEERSRIALVLRRAGFGAGPEELEHYAALGLEGTLDELLHPERPAEDFDALLEQLRGHLLDLQNIEDVQSWWLYRMVRTRRPLQEKLTLFWHGHFAVANAKVQNPLAMHRHVEMLRAHALGSYRELLLAVSRDPAMLLWLDGNTNRRGAPNENYARELLELYTLGVGHYTEADVQAVARAFTGWNLRDGKFFFDRNQHDEGEKTFLGERGPFDGADVLGLLVGHPATAERLCRKLFAFFAYPDPEPTVLGSLVAAYLDSGYDVGAVVEAILRSEPFYSERSRFGHVKSPVEYAVGSIRLLGAQTRERGLIQTLRGMGQEILNPPNVAGWAGGPAWVNPSTLLERFNFAARLATARGEPNDGGLVPAAELLGVGDDLADAEVMVDRLADLLGGLELSPEARQALVDYVQSPLTYPPYVKGRPNAQQTRQAIDARLRGAIHLFLVTAEYQIG